MTKLNLTRLKHFLKAETVLVIAAFGAILSMFFIHPNSEYIKYIDFRTLSLLFCLMLTISGLKNIGLFDALAFAIIPRFKNARTLCLILMLLCFFTSMFITNDVALITFVPFTIILYTASGLMERLIFTVALETAAANLGSMLTPVGNPQNLYLYSRFHISPAEFFSITLPVSVMGLIFLTASSLLCKKQPVILESQGSMPLLNKRKLFLYLLLFILCLLSVFYVIDYRVMVLLIFLVLIISDRKLLLHADYCLLLTFVCFFIFVGNAEKIEAVREVLTSFIKGREILSGVLLSQVISNVPAAVLLSGFTGNCRSLLLGTNIGGLGTLIASLASLISFKFYVRTENANPIRYLFAFTTLNIGLLLPILALSIMFLS